MARPIPANPAGLQRRYHYQATAQVVAPAQAVRRPSPHPALPVQEDARGEGQALSWGRLLLLVSVLTGGLAAVSALELWPPLAAPALGFDQRGAFYLLVAGVYLLASAAYVAQRTRLLRDLHRAAWDARLMAYANLAVGGAVSLALGIAALVAAAAVALLVGLIALLLSRAGTR